MNEQTAIELFDDFHGKESKKSFKIMLFNMSNLTLLGKVNAIEYRAKKHDDKKIETYRHEFETMPILLTNGVELILYGDIKITDRGIEG